MKKNKTLTYLPLRNHSHYSLLWSTNKCEQIIDECVKNGHTAVGLTDMHSISGAVRFIQKCQKKNIKPIIGCDVFLGDSYITLICLNNQGWHEMLKLISRSNDEDNFDKVAQISFEKLIQIIDSKNFACIDGYIGSQFHSSQDRESYVSQMRKEFKHYFLETDKISNHEYLEVIKELNDSIEKIDPNCEFTIPCTSTNYLKREDHIDHKLLMCVQLKTTLKKLQEKAEDIHHVKFLRNNTHYIKTDKEIHEAYSKKSIANLNSISDLCDPLDVLSKPLLPHFECPNNMSENEYLKDLCREGWRKLIASQVDKSLHEIYKDRVLEELGIIEKANLAGYFLIVQDYVNYFKKKGCLVGPSRGCFVPDTRIKMSDGSYMPISMVEYGDIVIDAYGDPREVYNKFAYEIHEDILELEFENNKIIRCTKDHKFLTKNRGWVEAQFLNEEDELVEI